MDIKRNILASVILLCLDFIWIYTYMGSKYKKMVQKIQKEVMKPNFTSILLAYCFMIIGLWIFVLPLKMNTEKIKNLSTVVFKAFLFGIVVYGIYDCTAGAVFTNFSKSLAIIDVLWGGFVYAFSSYIAIKIT